MKRVVVLGGGPAGAFAAERLAAAGLQTVVIDEKLAWEKPCGGGLTYKAYSQYPFLLENDRPKKLIAETCLSAEPSGSARLTLTHPIVIYSRYELNRMLLDRAEAAGAQLEKTRVTGLVRQDSGWRIQTRSGVLEADHVIVALGARNPLREVGTGFRGDNTMTALGYFVPVERQQIDLQFLPRFAGYIWVFPRQGHLSVGICGKERSAQQMKAQLHEYMQEHNLPIAGSTYYGHVLPSLNQSDWEENRFAGPGWMAVGDSAGLVDPITGEGIYYAIRSADLASQALIEGFDGSAERYQQAIRSELLHEMQTASRLCQKLYLGEFMGTSVPARMVQFVRSSASFCDVMQDLFAGTQNYVDLKARLMSNSSGILKEVGVSAARSLTLGVFGRS